MRRGYVGLGNLDAYRAIAPLGTQLGVHNLTICDDRMNKIDAEPPCQEFGAGTFENQDICPLTGLQATNLMSLVQGMCPVYGRGRDSFSGCHLHLVGS